MDSVVQIIHEIDPAIFPQIDSNEWSQDNMGPIYVPKKGVTVKINDENLPYYQQIIELYENNNLVPTMASYTSMEKKRTPIHFNKIITG